MLYAASLAGWKFLSRSVRIRKSDITYFLLVFMAFAVYSLTLFVLLALAIFSRRRHQKFTEGILIYGTFV